MVENPAPAPRQPPKPAATVLVVRDAPSLEVLMVRRNAGLSFGGSAWVFPGGKVSEADFDPDWSALAPGVDGAMERALKVAAAREAFEEAGLLLAEDDAGSPAAASLCERLAGEREEVEADPALFLRLLREHRLRLSLGRFAPFAHWITPDFEPRRFDTHFFLVAAPADQKACHDGREAVDHSWVQPGDLLQKRLQGEARLMFPTRLNLEVLARSVSATAAEAAARARSVVTVEPLVIERDGMRWLRIPGEAGYGLTEERLDRVMG